MIILEYLKYYFVGMNIKELAIKSLEDKRVMISTSRNAELLSEITELTNWMDVIWSDIGLRSRMFFIANGITKDNIDLCVSCGKPAALNKDTGGFRIFCGSACSRSYISPEILSLRNNKEWLYQQRIILKRPNEDIQKDLKITGKDLKTLYKTHNIPTIRLNASSPEVQIYLNDYDWLYNQHKILNKTTEQIAIEIGSSKSTISIALAKHNIPANPSNSYDRPHNNISNECASLVDWIKSWFDGEILLNKRTMFGGHEIDIYLPDLELAIEYNGVYSHLYRPYETTPAKIKGRTYHVNKTNICESLGIHLLHIWSCDWKGTKKNIIQSMIRNKAGRTERSIYARKCDIIELDAPTKNLFLDENHIQGRDKSKFKYGLVYEGELVSVMTFSTSRYNKNYDWELTRFSSKLNTNVIGGFSKLLAHFRKSNIGSIVSYADRTHSQGSVYRRNGFELVATGKPSYYWVEKNSEVMQHRFNFRKSKISTKTDPRTEEEIMYDSGYHKIWDCGNYVFVLN